MTTTNIEQVAQALLAARRERTVRDTAPLAGALHEAAEAYAVQDLVVRSLDSQPEGFPRYWKSGGLGREGLYPHAPLPVEGVWTSPADARGWHFNICMVEAEIALRLAREVSPAQAATIDYQQARALVDAMTVSIELVDSRWRQDPEVPPLLKLADLQAHGALVLGAWVPFAARDWSAQACTVKIGGKPVVAKRGTHPLGDPAALLPGWLRHATRNGATVAAGTAVTTGSWCGMLPSTPEDRVVVAFDGIGEASVQL
jgi:2-keto-4-pentenoate hydratase